MFKSIFYNAAQFSVNFSTFNIFTILDSSNCSQNNVKYNIDKLFSSTQKSAKIIFASVFDLIGFDVMDTSFNE